MPLPTALLTGAGLDASTNATLSRVWTLVQQYNALPTPLPPASQAAAVALLDKIMKHAAVYLTSKPPQAAKATNMARWNALADLATHAAQEASTVGTKLLAGPADFRQIRGDVNLGRHSYWLERVDPEHRPGFQLSNAYEAWLADGSAMHGKTSFWDYVDRQGLVMKVQFIKEGELDPATGAVLRENYRLNFAPDGRATTIDGSPFRTEFMETAHSGVGWAVFVVDLEGRMYANSHTVGYFHHSTFLAGRPVAAAGEVLIDPTGRIRFITAKTGHYKAGIAEMTRMVTLIPELPGDALILPDFTKMAPVAQGGLNEAHVYTVADFRTRGTRASYRIRPEVQAVFPGYGLNPGVLRMVNKVPLTRPLNASAPVFVPRGVRAGAGV
ncbi:MAG: hypothetical protein ACXW05_17310 [Gemmatirosa sp.]